MDEKLLRSSDWRGFVGTFTINHNRRGSDGHIQVRKRCSSRLSIPGVDIQCRFLTVGLFGKFYLTKFFWDNKAEIEYFSDRLLECHSSYPQNNKQILRKLSMHQINLDGKKSSCVCKTAERDTKIIYIYIYNKGKKEQIYRKLSITHC